MDEVVIRQAEVADLQSLTALLQLLFSIEEDFSFNEEKQLRGLHLMLENVSAVVLAAEIGGQVVGMCSGQLLISTAEGAASVLVEDVVVRPESRGKGVGRMLLQSVTKWSQERGGQRLQLLADKNNQTALGFYEHLGWETTDLICLRRKKSTTGDKR